MARPLHVARYVARPTRIEWPLVTHGGRFRACGVRSPPMALRSRPNPRGRRAPVAGAGRWYGGRWIDSCACSTADRSVRGDLCSLRPAVQMLRRSPLDTLVHAFRAG
jgi:hypothetical protein